MPEYAAQNGVDDEGHKAGFAEQAGRFRRGVGDLPAGETAFP